MFLPSGAGWKRQSRHSQWYVLSVIQCKQSFCKPSRVTVGSVALRPTLRLIRNNPPKQHHFLVYAVTLITRNDSPPLFYRLINFGISCTLHISHKWHWTHAQKGFSFSCGTNEGCNSSKRCYGWLPATPPTLMDHPSRERLAIGVILSLVTLSGHNTVLFASGP